MTKTLKKGLVAVLLFVLASACVFLGLNTTRAYADLTPTEQTFVNDFAAFKTIADEDEDGVLTATEVRTAMGTAADTYFMSMYMHVNNMASDTTDESYVAARTAYDDILAQYDLNGAALLFSNLTTRITYIYTKTGYSYVNAAEVADFRAKFEALSEEGKEADLAFFKNATNWETTWVDTDEDEELDTPEQLIKAEAKIAEWKADIDNAIAAIRAIEALEVTIDDTDPEDVITNEEMVAIYDADEEAYVDGLTIVLASKASIETARTAADKVEANGDIVFIESELPYLTAAEEALAAQQAKIKAVEDKIAAAYAKYSEIADAEVCYTIKADIDGAKAAYDALDTDTYNDLKANVSGTAYANLDKMVNKLAAVTTAIANVKTAIDEIPATAYTNAFKSKIAAARTAFDALPADVKAVEADEATRGTCVANYAALLSAEKGWAALVKEVEDVIAKINALQVVEAEDPENLYGAIIEMYGAYNGLSDKTNQYNGDSANGIKGINATALETPFQPTGYIEAITTCKGSYDYYVGIMGDIATAVNPIKTAIEALYTTYGEHARFINDFETKISAITAQIDALPKKDGALDPRYKGAIDNYAKYETLLTDYNALLDLANAWADKVDAIEAVSVSSFDKVAEAETAFAEIAPYAYTLDTDLSTFAKKYVKEDAEKAYSAYYTTFVNYRNLRTTIIEKLNEAKTAINSLVRPAVVGGTHDDVDDEENPVVVPNYESYAAAQEAYNAYSLAVFAANEKVYALSAYDAEGKEGETIAFFVENENYSAAAEKLMENFKYLQAGAIELAIAKIEAFADETEDYITEARAQIKDLLDEEVPEGTEEPFTAEDVVNAVRNLDVLTGAEEKLGAWKDAVAAILTGAAIDGSDVEEVAVYTTVTKNNVANGFFKLDVVAAKALRAEYAEYTNVEKSYAALNGKLDILEKAIVVAGTNEDVEGAKLYFIDNAIEGYYEAFNNNNSLDAYPTLNELKSYVAALTESQLALLHNVEKLSAVEGSQKMAKDLAAAIDKLYADVADGKVNAVSAIEYYTIASIYNGLTVAKRDMVNAELEGDYTVDEAFAAIEEKVAAADVNVEDQIKTAIATAVADYVKTETFNTAIAEYMKTEAFNDAIAAYLTKEAFNTAIADYMKTEAFNDAIAAYLTKEAFNTAIAAYLTTEAFNDTIAAYVKTTDLITILADFVTDAEFDVVKGEIEAKIAAEKAAREAADAAEKAAREAADAAAKEANEKAIADLQAQIDALQKKSTVTIIVFAVVCVALCACVIVLFIKKKQA